MTDTRSPICDVVMLAWSKTEVEYAMTCEAVRTLRASSAGRINLVVVETNQGLVKESWFTGPPYHDPEISDVVFPQADFGYNDFILRGLDRIPAPGATCVMIVNNDIVFHPGCVDELVKAMGRNASASPMCPVRHKAIWDAQPPEVNHLFGWHVSERVCGWALMFRRSLLEQIGWEMLFPRALRGWWQDKWYADRMRETGVRHALVRRAVAEHLGSKSLDLLPMEENADLTHGQRGVYEALTRELRISRRTPEPRTSPAVVERRLRVAVYAIAKNESAHVGRWLKAIGDGADCIVVADTGSGDGTPDLLRAGGAMVYPITVNPWRFDTARNTALALVPRDVDVCLSVDLDEVLPDNWRGLVETAWKPGTVQGSYICNTHFGEDGKPIASFSRNNFHSRNGFMWKYPIHEAVEYIGDSDKYICIVIDGLTTDHRSDGKPRPKYLPLLTKAVKEDPCARNLYYLTRELFYREVWEQLAVLADEYLLLDGEDPAERSAVMRWKALAHLRLGKPEEADRWFYRSAAEDPNRREPWVALARFHVLHGRWAEGYAASKRALEITERPVHHLTDPDCWGKHPQDLIDRCAEKLGLLSARTVPVNGRLPVWTGPMADPAYRERMQAIIRIAENKVAVPAEAAV